jgi:hypothetical protein
VNDQIMKTRAQRLRRRGFVLVTFVVSATALLVVMGLAIDVGYLQLVKTRAQAAADAAAMGGAQQIRMSGQANAASAARADAAANGFTNGQDGVTVTVNTPPSSGYSSGDASAVEVVISKSVPAFFMEFAGVSTSYVQARAVARRGGSTDSIYALDTGNTSAAFSVSGGSTAIVHGGIVVNSSNSSGLKVSGGSSVTATAARVVGGASVTGGSFMTPTASTGVAITPDPLANLAAPSVGTCNYTSLAINWAATTQYLNPGVYCRGITIGNGAVVVFNPGTYIFKGGGLNIGGGTTVSGTGVTFYNSAASGYTYGPITFGGGAYIDFSAPTTGAMAGILFFQDRSVVGGSASSLAGGANVRLQGTLYFPTTAMTYSGGVSLPAKYTLIVAKTVTISGGVTLNNDFSSLPDGSPIKGNALISE